MTYRVAFLGMVSKAFQDHLLTSTTVIPLHHPTCPDFPSLADSSHLLPPTLAIPSNGSTNPTLLCEVQASRPLLLYLFLTFPSPQRDEQVSAPASVLLPDDFGIYHLFIS
jgi:hypothetical protein